jgi:hypothetical protein
MDCERAFHRAGLVASKSAARASKSTSPTWSAPATGPGAPFLSRPTRIFHRHPRRNARNRIPPATRRRALKLLASADGCTEAAIPDQ